jgi:hypothetical protein
MRLGNQVANPVDLVAFFIVLPQEFASRSQAAATHCHFAIRFLYRFVADIVLPGYSMTPRRDGGSQARCANLVVSAARIS